MISELVVCKIEMNVTPLNQIVYSLKRNHSKHFLGFRKNGGLLLFFSKEVLEDNYYSFLSNLSSFGKLNGVSLQKIDMEKLLKEMRAFSYFTSRNTIETT